MEPQELSPALLHLPVTVVAILGELLATLPSLNEEMRLFISAKLFYRVLQDFTKELRATLSCIDDTWRRHNVTLDGDDPPTSLSRALATYKSTPWTTWNRVTMAAILWKQSAAALEDNWAELARKATRLRNAWMGVLDGAANRAATITFCANDLQEEAARYEIPQENMVERGLALGMKGGAEVESEDEARVRREAKMAASEAARATMVRERVEVALGLLERLVVACDEATAFPRELQRLLRDIEAAPKRANEASPDVPEDLVANAAEAKRLWEANARLAKDHLLGAVDGIKFYCDGGPDGPSACGVAERCQRAIKDIPRLLHPPDCPQGVTKVSPVTLELREVSPPQLQVLVDVMATLGEVVTTVTGPHRAQCLHESPDSLHEDLRRLTQSLCRILDHGDVTALGHSGIPSLGRALATLGATPGTTWSNVRAAAKAWRELVARLVDSWDCLAREATKLCDTCGKVVRALQLLVALDKEEVTWAITPHNAQVVAATNEDMGEAGLATRGAMVATRRGHWAKVALGPLQRLVATCDRATLFYWNMEWRLRDVEAILKGTNEVSPDVLQASVAKVAKFEWLWGASTRLAKDHLLGTLGVIDNILLSPYGGLGGPGGPGSCAVAERCQKAIEDIPRLLLWWCLQVPGQGKR